MNLTTGYTTRLVFIWRLTSLDIFIDGSFYKTISQSDRRVYYESNYVPIKTLKLLRSTLVKVEFNDTALNNSDLAVTGKKEKMLISKLRRDLNYRLSI